MIRRRAPRSHRAHRAHRDERGMALAELSFVSIMLLSMLGASIDLGLAWESGLAINEAARTGARVGSGQADAPGADYYALTGMKASLATAGKLEDVEKVVVYRASAGLNGGVPASCLSAAPSGTCNVLTGDQFRALDFDDFDLTRAAPDVPPAGSGCLLSGAAQLRNWCPTVRERRMSAGADRYGVYVAYRHHNIFPVTGSHRSISRTAVMRLEPRQL